MVFPARLAGRRRGAKDCATDPIQYVQGCAPAVGRRNRASQNRDKAFGQACGLCSIGFVTLCLRHGFPLIGPAVRFRCPAPEIEPGRMTGAP